MNHHPTTLITGAGKRIGAEIARHLAAKGHHLVLHYQHSKAEAEALAQEIGTKRVTLIQANLADPAALTDFWRTLPPCTSIIHNASRYTRDTLASMKAGDLHEHLAVNLEAPLLLTQGFMKQLPKDTTGNVIMLGDGTLGWSISPEFFSYAISKHAWAGAIDLLAAACAPRARVNMIALAPTLPGENDDASMFNRLAEHAPLKRTGSVAEVLTAIDFVLASPGLTGETITLANGLGLVSRRPA